MQVQTTGLWQSQDFRADEFSVIERKKHPLKNEKIVKDPMEYRIEAIERFKKGYFDFLERGEY